MNPTAKSTLWRQFLVALPPVVAIVYVCSLLIWEPTTNRALFIFYLVAVIVMVGWLIGLLVNSVIKVAFYGMPKHYLKRYEATLIIASLLGCLKIFIDMRLHRQYPVDAGFLVMIGAMVGMTIHIATQKAPTPDKTS